MKIWKLIGCVGLLAVIVCGCVILAQGNVVSAKEPNEEQTPPTEQTPSAQAPQESEEAPPTEEEPSENTATVEKIYSSGLLFRSNGDGTCALAGLGSCTASCVLIPPESPAGDKVIEILAGAFRNSVIGAIEIPATVELLSAAAFEGCLRLSYIRVAPGNNALSELDGVLYSADGRTLIYCPAGRSAKELTLHKALRRILAGAFAECNALTTIYFIGTTAEWHGIIVGDDNDALYHAGLKFKTE